MRTEVSKKWTKLTHECVFSFFKCDKCAVKYSWQAPSKFLGCPLPPMRPTSVYKKPGRIAANFESHIHNTVYTPQKIHGLFYTVRKFEVIRCHSIYNNNHFVNGHVVIDGLDHGWANFSEKKPRFRLIYRLIPQSKLASSEACFMFSFGCGPW